MIKNLTSSQLFLMALAALLLLLAAFSFYLLQDPSAALPFARLPPTSSPTSPPPTQANTTSPTVPTPTRQTSYTPLAAYRTPSPFSPIQVTPSSSAATPSQLTPRATPSRTSQVTQPTTQPNPTTPARTPTSSPLSPTATGSPTIPPSATATLPQGVYGVTGQVIQNGTPVPGVVVEFADDTAPRQATTNSDGDYSFITLAPGTDFTLTFYQADNPNLKPAAEITSLAWLKGTLSDGGDYIELPDLEISINLSGSLFELASPDDQASVSAAAISGVNPIEFSWSSYAQNGTYHVELGPSNSDTPIWSSTQLTEDNFMWNGTLDDGSHVTQGTYWWRVGVTRSVGNDILVVFTQPFDLIFTP